MPKLQMFQIDAFATSLFKGNPAAVCPLDDSMLQAIAQENNLSETAFFVCGFAALRIRQTFADADQRCVSGRQDRGQG